MYDDLTPVEWWPKNSGYKGSNSANDIRCKDTHYTIILIGNANFSFTGEQMGNSFIQM